MSQGGGEPGGHGVAPEPGPQQSGNVMGPLKATALSR